MEKLKLDLESLTVETFEPLAVSPRPGTVQGYDSFTATTGGPDFCPEECGTTLPGCI